MGKYIYLERADLGKLFWRLPPAAWGAGAWVIVRLPHAAGRYYYLHWKSAVLQDEKYFSLYDVGLRVAKGEGEEFWLLPAWPCADIAVYETWPRGDFVRYIPLTDVALSVEEARSILAKEEESGAY